MGYTRIIQSGDYIEIYQYQKKKNDVRTNERSVSRNKRRSTSYYRRSKKVYLRRDSSIQRSKASFFRLVASNLEGEEKPVFITCTTYQVFDVSIAYEFLRIFFRKIRKHKGEHVRYIAVPEWQPESGFIHFHCVVWGLTEDNQAWEKIERDRRNYQRQWLRGYVDLSPAYDTSLAIAGYMAKYLAKAYSDERLYNIRAYSASGNIKRPLSSASNTLIEYMDEIVNGDEELCKLKEYDTMWLGRCNYRQLKKKR